MQTKKINIGNFNEPITWRKPTATKSSKGNTARSYTDYKTDYIELLPNALTEGEASGRLQDTETITIQCHFDAEPDNTWQFIWNGETYNLLHKPVAINLKRFMYVKAQLINK